ncbi:MAG: site-2 protease family protein, partial [Candidatus Curtissbacteria bacterium]|nr:site-2 protease family protein [Candidatus Curtissbacteria bacterium]
MNRNILLYILAFMILMSFATGGLPDILQTLINQPLVGISLIAGLVIGISLHEFSHALVAYR